MSGCCERVILNGNDAYRRRIIIIITCLPHDYVEIQVSICRAISVLPLRRYSIRGSIRRTGQIGSPIGNRITTSAVLSALQLKRAPAPMRVSIKRYSRRSAR